MFVEALDIIEPPLLNAELARPVLRILHRRRGRPPKGERSRVEIAKSILQINRPDVPRGFLGALADRLLLERGLKELDRAMPFHREREKRIRNDLMVGIYKDLYALLGDGRDVINHSVLGRIDVPTELQTRSERALEMTREQLSARGYDPPSTRRMFNIISPRLSQKRKSRTFS